MATNWPPAPGTYPAWPPAELGMHDLSFSDIQTGITYLRQRGFVKATPTTAENSAFFNQARCDHGHLCSGIMIVSPGGLRYPFAYCNTANHRSALVLWEVGNGSYDLGWGSGVII